MQHLETNSFLYGLQHGFRQNRSCETQLLSFIHELMFNHDKDIQSDIILMDFAKAFDKIPQWPQTFTLQAVLVWCPREHPPLDPVIFK